MEDRLNGKVRVRKATPEELAEAFKNVKPIPHKGLAWAPNPFLGAHDFIDHSGMRHHKGRSEIV